MDENPTRSPVIGGTLQQIQAVILVAFLLATLFTAWTPSGLLPDSLAERLSNTILQEENPVDSTWSTSTPRPRSRIGIVAGHWGNDPGAVCPDGLTEAEVNQEIATRVRESLIGEGYEVDLLKEFDQRLHGYRALVLVSIHADSCDYFGDTATGFKVSAAESTVYTDKAARLIGCLRHRYQAATGLNFHSTTITPDMSSYHAFYEIHSDTTAAIIETGFLNLDRQILTEQPDLVSRGIVDGILCFVRNENIPGLTPEEP
jgi:N-acetylmuramoyl-L-alanine amidase